MTKPPPITGTIAVEFPPMVFGKGGLDYGPPKPPSERYKLAQKAKRLGISTTELKRRLQAAG